MKTERPVNNLHTDSSYVDQPENTTRFVLNGVDETLQGDRNFVTNEESNEQRYEITDGYIPLEEVSVSNEEIVIFSVASDESSSEIGIIDRNDNYKVLVNFDLGFKITQQIRATYRLRRGCERTIYWTDPRVRYFNIDRPDQFKTNDIFDIDKFSLFRTYDDVPTFNDIEVTENGNLIPGSYNFAIQYVDDDLNPTEWITTSPVINIYNDRLSKEYKDINGSTNVRNDYQDFGNTSKSIRLNLGNLDEDYAFYRIAVIESTNGSGQVSNVTVSQEISTQIKTWEYSGQQTLENITEEEIQEFQTIIDEAEFIEQIENTLLLGNTKGKQINFCKLQKYASRIKADVTFQSVLLNEISESNPKSPTLNFEGRGYMPGEIYSFGIVYIFKDGTQSPVYHIPGKNSNTENQSFVQDQLIRPMSIDNVLQNTFYTDNSECEDFWGLDSEGTILKDEPVRHHRFPLRSEVLKPLLEDVTNTTDLNINNLSLNISGTIDASYTDETIDYAIEYTINGNTNIFESSINVSNYDPNTGINVNIISSSNDIVVVNILENNTIISNPSPSTALTYTTTIGNNPFEISNKLYQSEMFGIRFSGIDLPNSIEVGDEIIGYYIVRNERTEDNKTILDTGVITPLLDETTEQDGFFVAHGHIMPELNDTGKIKNDIVGLIHPEHKFNNTTYTSTTEIIKEGEFSLIGDQSLSSVITQDVMPGTSYDPEVARRRERDSDGFDLHTLTRDSEVQYNRIFSNFASDAEIDDIFYLDALNGRSVNDNSDMDKEVYNLSSDNRIGIISMNKEIPTNELYQRLPFVVLKRNLNDPYSSFRYLPYFKETTNRIRFVKDVNDNLVLGDTVDVFNGDVQVTSMRYTSTMFYDVRTRNRASKSGILNAIIGVLAIVAGALLTVITAGLGAAAGIALIGFGVTQVATGIKKEQIARVYNELYDAGLRNAVDDNDTNDTFGPNPPDDEVQWLSDTVTNLWFESTVNMGLRNTITSGIPDFLVSPSSKATPGQSGGSSESTEQNELDSYILDKLTILDSDNDNGRVYQGFANAEFYEINNDFTRINKQKIFNALGIEFDCCSDCQEEFPNRIHYSQQSFQEELTDNYRVFLPNDYRDIEGEKGQITGIYRFYNNVFVHTEESLWNLPQNYQERVTNQIVSFLGTGSYFETPARRIIDSSKAIGGTKFSEGVIKTPNGILFPSERDRKIYLFNGQELEALSKTNYNWFKNNMDLLSNNQYYNSNEREYPFLNNPSNPFGTGFISTYDSRKERFIVTKKDFSLPQDIIDNDDYELCYEGGQLIIFNNFQQTIDEQEALGWEFIGIENCELQFTRIITEEIEEDRQEIVQVANDTDIHIFFDTSGSFDAPALAQIDQSVDNWIANFASANPDWTGTLYKYNDATERWVNYANTISTTTYGGNTAGRNIIVISFCNESNPIYHGAAFSTQITAPTTDYTTDYNNFVNTVFPSYNSFVGIHYPIIFNTLESSKEFLLHSLAALKGTSYTQAEVDNLNENTGLTSAEQTQLETALLGTNPYPNGLENFGWLIKENRYNDNNTVITSSQFQTDITELLEGVLEINNITVTVNVPVIETNSIPGVPYDSNLLIDLNNSWTMSYSLKSTNWVSWHSYIPDFYIFNTDRFFSWRNGNNFIWEHNIKGSYQKYYGEFNPHIIEYVIKDNPTITKIWDWLLLQTEAKRYDSINNEYIDERFITHNKGVFYNTRQNTGVLNLIVKDTKPNVENYFNQQIEHNPGDIIIDRNERNWTINDLRDIIINNSESMFISSLSSLQSEYYTDKILNDTVLDINKDWTQQESFRDKFLVVRLIFDNFDNIQLTTNYTVSSEVDSKR